MQRFKHDHPRFYPDLDGDYVLHSEAQARIEALEAALRDCVEALESAHHVIGYNCDGTHCQQGKAISKARAALENSK